MIRLPRSFELFDLSDSLNVRLYRLSQYVCELMTEGLDIQGLECGEEQINITDGEIKRGAWCRKLVAGHG